MKKWHVIGIVCAIGWLLLVWIGIQMATGERMFAKYVQSPVPKSIVNVLCEADDWFGFKRKLVCHILFSGSPADLQTIAAKFETTPANEMFFRPAPGWFQPALTSTNGPFYRRKGKRGPEYLWIDSTGTNAYFLTFGV